jgi:hypothetical protein
VWGVKMRTCGGEDVQTSDPLPPVAGGGISVAGEPLLRIPALAAFVHRSAMPALAQALRAFVRCECTLIALAKMPSSPCTAEG